MIVIAGAEYDQSQTLVCKTLGGMYAVKAKPKSYGQMSIVDFFPTEEEAKFVANRLHLLKDNTVVIYHGGRMAVETFKGEPVPLLTKFRPNQQQSTINNQQASSAA